jgi:hypothetical protein
LRSSDKDKVKNSGSGISYFFYILFTVSVFCASICYSALLLLTP